MHVKSQRFFIRTGQKRDHIVNIETDKVTTDIPSPVSGKIIKLFSDTGEVIKVSDTLVEIDTRNPCDQLSEEVSEQEVKKNTRKETLKNNEGYNVATLFITGGPTWT